ncbi:MAG: dGTPase, partial [Mesonia sp.]
GLIEEEKALELLIKLVEKNIRPENYSQLTSTQSRLSYLRSLAISTLIQEAANIFIENEEKILNGEFQTSLLDKSKYKVQIEDIINISIQNIYQSQDVTEKEITGYQIINTILDKFCNSAERKSNQSATNYDILISQTYLKDLDEEQDIHKWLIDISSYVASLSDGNALRIYQKINGFHL